ncbi:MAG: hypothetical protein V1708_03005, partial [Candidatus Micrarchaeota archaeon]
GIAMEADLPYGPWKKLFSAVWSGYPLQAYSNPDRLLLMLMFEKKGEEITGVLVLERQAFVVEGNFSGASIAQRDMTYIEKKGKSGTSKFLIIDSTPAFVAYSDEELSNEVTRQYGELESVGKVLKKAVAEYAGVKLVELKKADSREAEALYGDPVILLSIGKHGGVYKDTGGAKSAIGMTASKEPYEIPLDRLRSAGIAGSEKEKRLHAMHVMIESALENGIPCVVFDSSGAFGGLGMPNRDNADFSAFGMREATGYPVRQFELGKGLFIDLELVDSDMFLSAFGIDKSEVAGVIKKIYEEKRGKVSFLGDLVSELNALPETTDSPRFVTNKAIRVLEAISKLNPSLFAKNMAEELSAPWKDGVPKVILVSLAGQRPEIQRLVIYSIVKALSKPSVSGFSTLLAFEPDASTLHEETGKLLSAIYRQGKGFVVQAEHESDFSALAEIKTMLEMVGADAIVTDKEERVKKRVTLRPAYSHCSEYTTAAPKK